MFGGIGGSSLGQILVKDVNGDGIPDLIATAYSKNQVVVMLGNGDGTFGAGNGFSSYTANTFAYNAGVNPDGIVAADFDGDGNVDLAVSNNTDPGSVTLLHNGGNGTFNSSATYAVGSQPTGLVAADFNGDGKVDLAVADRANVVGTHINTVAVLLNAGNGTLGAASYFAAGDGPDALAAGDLNGDGNVDLVVGTADISNTAGTRIFSGNGDGTFTADGAYPTGSSSYNAAVADMNGDGRLDVVVASAFTSKVTVLANTTVQTNVSVAAVTSTYGDTAQTLTATLSSGLPLAGETVTFSVNGAVLGTAVTNASGVASLPVNLGALDAGTYAGGIVASFAGDDALQIGGGTGSATLMVKKAPLSVSVASASRVYGDPNPAVAVTITGVLNNDAISATSAAAASATSDVGSYGLTAAISDPNNRLKNYAVTETDGTLTITPRPLSVTANNASAVYGQPTPALGGTLAGLVNNDPISATYATSATPTSNVGAYAITPAVSGPATKLADYAVSVVPGTLTVAPASALTAYTGDDLATADSTGAVIFNLRATVVDNNAGSVGAITTAAVTFKIFDGNTLVGTVAGSPVGLTGTGPTTGDSTATWSTNLGTASSHSYRVQVVVGGNYTASSPGNDLLVAGKPGGAASGAGFFFAGNSSAGALAADPGSRISYGFNVRDSLKQGLDGEAHVIFVRTINGLAHTFEADSRSILSYGEDPVTGLANFTALADVTDVTNRGRPVTVATGVTLQFDVTDSPVSPKANTVGVTIWNGTTLTFSSDWNGLQTLQDLLSGGTVVVK
jgi:hypothetical protein